MKLTARIPVTAGLMALILFSATGCKRLRANYEINKGVASFKDAKLEAATNHFQQAISIDPDNPNPRLYLATTYASQVVPNLDTPENKKFADEALKGFHEILDKDPKNLNALKQIASLERNVGHADVSKQYQLQVIALDPSDAEAIESIGGADFYLAYKNALGFLKAEGLDDKGDGNLKLSKGGCARLKQVNDPIIAEGMTDLKKATEINPTYEEAYTYLSLLSRRKADTECGNIPAVKQDLADADMYAQKSMGARKEIERQKEAKDHGVAAQ